MHPHLSSIFLVYIISHNRVPPVDLTSSVLVPFGTTGRVCLKSPASKTVTPPIKLLFPLISFRDLFKVSTPALRATVISSYTTNFVSFKTSTKLLCFDILQKEVTEIVRLSGNLKVAGPFGHPRAV